MKNEFFHVQGSFIYRTSNCQITVIIFWQNRACRLVNIEFEVKRTIMVEKKVNYSGLTNRILVFKNIYIRHKVDS